LVSYSFEVPREQIAPGCVAGANRCFRRAHDVAEEERDEHAAARASVPGPVPETAPLDLDDRLVADRMAVVAGRDVEHVAGPEDDRGAVREVDPELSRDHEADVPNRAPLAADGRADVLR